LAPQTRRYTTVFMGPDLGTATAVAQWRVLAEVGQALSRCARPEMGLPDVAGLVVPQAANWCVLYLPGDNEVAATLDVAHVEMGRAEEIRGRLRGRLTRLEGDRRLLAELGVSGGQVTPVRFGSRTRGLLALASEAGDLEGAGDLEFGRALADRIGLELGCTLAYRQTQRAIAAGELAVGIVSHDLGNPLATIQICANALLDPRPQPVAGIRQIAEIIQRSAAWMQQIRRDLLDRVHLDTGGLPLARESTAVSDVMGTVEKMFLPVAGEQGLEFAIECAADLPRIDADPGRLQQALSNLLGNAMKFTPAGGRVVLSARAVADQERGPAIRFAVSDTGPGIPEQDLPHVFDWFWHSQAGERTGTGLGLAIARGVIEAHSAHLMVESAPGGGSTFWFTLPACGTRAEGCHGGIEARG